MSLDDSNMKQLCPRCVCHFHRGHDFKALEEFRQSSTQLKLLLSWESEVKQLYGEAKKCYGQMLKPVSCVLEPRI